MMNNHQGSSNPKELKKQQTFPQQQQPLLQNKQLPPNNFLKGGNQILFSQATSPITNPLAPSGADSAVKGRRLNQQELNVVCGVNQHENFRDVEMISSYNGPGFKQLLSGQEQNQHSQKRDRSEKQREVQKLNQQKATTSSGGASQSSQQQQQYNAFRTRKSSTDSHGGANNRQARFNSSGRSEKKRGGAKSSSNSQSRGVSSGTGGSKNPHEQRLAGLNHQATNLGKMNSGQGTNANLQGSLKRPSSAKNLKNVPSVASMTGGQKNNLVNSPTQTNLRREMSINQLPPKNPPAGGSNKNSKNQNPMPMAFAKLPKPLYQSVGAHPISGHSQSQQSNSNSSKRVPSASSERKQFESGFGSLASSMTGAQLRMQRLSQPLNNNFVSSQDMASGEKSVPFSPLRSNNRYHQESTATQPTSGHKPHYLYSAEKNSQSRSKNRKQKQNIQNSNVKLKSPASQAYIFTADQQNLQTLSPNLGRIRADQIISEEFKEDSFNRYDGVNHQMPLSSFDSNEYMSLHGQQAQNPNSMNMFNIQFDPSQSSPNLFHGINNIGLGDGNYFYPGQKNVESHATLPQSQPTTTSNLAQTASRKLIDPSSMKEIQKSLREYMSQQDAQKRKKNSKTASSQQNHPHQTQGQNQNTIFGQPKHSGKENFNNKAHDYGQTASPNDKANYEQQHNNDNIFRNQLNSVQSQQQLRANPKRLNAELVKQQLEQKLQGTLGKKLNRKGPNVQSTQTLANTHSKQQEMQNELQRKEMIEQKQRRQQSREQHNRQREELQEIRAFMQDTLKNAQPVNVLPKSQQQSNSQTRQLKPENVRPSTQRPFSAKTGGGSDHQQLLIKMPPVSIEGSNNPYDVIAMQQQMLQNDNLNELQGLSSHQQPHVSDTSPLRTNKYDHSQKHFMLMSVGSEQNMKSDNIFAMMRQGLKTAKREKSKKPKKEDVQNAPNIGQQSTKALNAQLLKQRIESGFDDFKGKLSSQLGKKLKKGTKGMKSQKVLEQAQQPYTPHGLNIITPQSAAGQNDERLTRKAMQHRSKSKKRLDEEKENKRLSNSPSRDGTSGPRLGSKDARSGTKSRSDKKKRRKHQQQVYLLNQHNNGQDDNKVTDAQYQNMKQNVIELLQKQNMMEQAQKLMRSSVERPNLNVGKQTLKSQTVANLHQALQDGAGKRNQIQITKSMLKNLQMRKNSGKSSQANSNYEVDRSSSQHNQLELSRGQLDMLQQMNPQQFLSAQQPINFYPQQQLGQDGAYSVSTPNLHDPQLLAMLQGQNYDQHQRLMYMSTDSNQHIQPGTSELTPIIQGKGQKRKQHQHQINSGNFDSQNLLFTSQQLQKMGSAHEVQSLGALINKNGQGVRPIDSLQSFQFNGNQLESLSQSREDLSIFRSQDNNMMRGGNQLHNQQNYDNQLILIDPSNPQQMLQPFEYRSLSSLNLHPQQPSSKAMRSRSGSVEHQSSVGANAQSQKLKSNKKKKSNKKQKNGDKHHPDRARDFNPVQLNLVSPTKGSGVERNRDNSGSKTRKSGELAKAASQASLQRKGSAGYKRNQASQGQLSQQQFLHQQQLIPVAGINFGQIPMSSLPQSIPTSVTNKQLKTNQIPQAFSGTSSTTNKQLQKVNLRPKSAAVQSNAAQLSDAQSNQFRVSQKQRQNEHIDPLQLAIKYNEAAVTVKRYLKRYIAKQRVSQLLAEKREVEKNLKHVQSKYWSQQQQQALTGKGSQLRSSVESLRNNGQQQPPIKQLFTNEQQNLLQFNNNIQILDEESKGDGRLFGSMQPDSAMRQSQESQKLKISTSSQDFKALLQKEALKLKQQQSQQISQKSSRPQSSEVYKNQPPVQNKVPRIGSAGANQTKSSEMNQAPSSHHEIAKSDKSSKHDLQMQQQQQKMMASSQGFKMLDRRGSQQSAATSGSQKQIASQNQAASKQAEVQQQPKYEEVKQYPIQNKILEKEIPKISRNLNDQFDSMASINKLSEELNFKRDSNQNNKEENRLNETSNKHDSFLKSLILNESYQNHLQNQRPSHPIQQQQQQTKGSQFNKKLPTGTLSDQHMGQNPSQGGFNTSSHLLGSDERDMSWQFDRRSFQDQFVPLPPMPILHSQAPADQSKSHILQEEFKRQTIEAIQASGSNKNSSIPLLQSDQQEQYLQNLAKKTELGRQELKKYQDKLYLSPASQKRKTELEKWVEKKEQKLQGKRSSSHNDNNMSDIISQIQMNKDLTQRKINQGTIAANHHGTSSARKESNTSVRFNVSHEISQIDMSLGHISNISLNATPRVQGANQIIPSSGPVVANALNTSSGMNNRSQSADQQSSKVGEGNNNRKLFDYKLAGAAANSNNSVTPKSSLPPQQNQTKEALAKSKIDSSSSSLARDPNQRSRISNLLDNNSSQNNMSKRSMKSEKSQQIQNRSLNEDMLNKQKSLTSDKDMAAPGLGLQGFENHSMRDEDPDERSNIFKNDTSESRTPQDFSKTAKNEDLGRQSDLFQKQVSQGAQSQHQNSASQRFRESDIITSSAADDTYPVDEDQLHGLPMSMGQDDDQENESLSKMEPPQFQSPTMSAISPNQQMRDYFSEEDDKNAPPLHPSHQIGGALRPFNLNKFEINSSQNEIEEEKAQLTDKEKKKSANQNLSTLLGGDKLSQVNFSGSDSEREYSQAFLALKEPEQPITLEKVKQMKEKEERVAQTEILTDYILALLVEQVKHNLFPKRAVIMKSPSKGSSMNGDESVNHTLLDSYNSEGAVGPQDIPASIIDEFIRSEELSDRKKKQNPSEPSMFDPDRSPEGEDQSPSSRSAGAGNLAQSNPPVQVPKKKKVRGIKTTMRVVDQYVAQVFGKVKENEDEFVENLSTPLNKDPLEILLHLQNSIQEGEIEAAVAYQQSVLPVDLYLDLERKKDDVQVQDAQSDDEAAAEIVMNKSMMGEWENIHNKVIFDGINEALDNFRPYGLRGPPMPWSQQTRTLTYKNGQQVDSVLKQVRLKVMEWARTFAGALPCSELLQEYGIKGPLDEDKLTLLREERLALVLAAEIEENEQLWTDYEYEETQSKLDVADMILEFLAEEVARDLNSIQQSRQLKSQQSETSATADTTEIGASSLNTGIHNQSQ